MDDGVGQLVPNVVQLGQEEEAKGGRGRGENQRRDGDEGERDTLRNEVGQDDYNSAGDDHQVHRHANVLAVVQRGNFHVTRLPRHVDAHNQQEALIRVQCTQPALRVLRTTHFHLLEW